MTDPLDQILATAIQQAQAIGRKDVSTAAEEAAKAYAAGLAAFQATRSLPSSVAVPSAEQ